ncbi:hypothetical protein GGF46_004868 [Coemansia sp. RSA 552]|nr:hypothetical protein GGF46_004868 [Coemansia sp. RSA 552]
MTNLTLHRTTAPSDERPSAHRHGLRRAKTATANSIKKLFKSRRDSKPPVDDDLDEPRSRRASALVAIDTASPGPPTLPVEPRPSSVHSTRSVRSILSTARRIKLRTSMAFRHHAPDADQHIPDVPGIPLVPAGEPQTPSHPGTADPPAGVSSVRHTAAALTDSGCAGGNGGGGGLGGRSRSALSARSAHAALSPQAQKPQKLVRHQQHPPMPARALPSVPHTPPTSCSSAGGAAKSPGAYSSKSLGLNTLDFGYDEHVAHGLLPSSPTDQSCASETDDLSVGSLSTHTSGSCRAELQSPATPVSEECEIVETIQLVAVPEPEGADLLHRSIVAGPEGMVDEDPYPRLLHTVQAIEAIVRELGSATGISDRVLPRPIRSRGSSNAAVASDAASSASSPYVVRDIDELLAELGITDSLIGTQSPDPKAMPGMGGGAVARGRVSDEDTFSLREIDELLQQLDEAAGSRKERAKAAGASSGSVQQDLPILDIARIVGGLGDVGLVVDAAVLAVAGQQPDPMPVHTILELPVPEAEAFFCDPVGLVAALGRIVEAADIITDLGGMYMPGLLAKDIERGGRKASNAQMPVDDNGGIPSTDITTYNHTADASPVCLPAGQCPQQASPVLSHVGLPGMDVDEATARSRTNSVISYNQPYENIHSITKLIAALHIGPIVVSRPFLGPSRCVLFPHFC